MRLRLVPILVVVAIIAAAVFAAVTASPANSFPNKAQACTSCHSGAPSGAVTAAPSTTTPAAGATYTVAIKIGLTASGSTGYHIAQTDASGTSTTWTTVYAGGASFPQTSWTATMTAPAAPGTYYYKVWCAKGVDDNTGMARSVDYRITVPAAAPPIATLTSSTHPVEATWYASNLPKLAWTASDLSGITGYSYLIDHVATTLPDAVSEGTATTKSYAALADGLWYFHVRARNGAGLWGATRTRAVRIGIGP